MIKFSIITVCYNDCQGLKKTMDSVFSQTFGNYEFLIIDGGSSDGSKKLIIQYQDKLSFWCSESDKGIYNAMNKGVKHAQGKYILFLNAGDVFHSSNVLEKVACQLEDKDIVSGYALRNGKSILNIHEKNVLMMFFHSTFSHQSTFIKRELFDDYQYDESLKYVADWKAWIDWVVKGGKTYKYIDTVVCDYDFNGISSDSANWEDILKEREKVLNASFSPLILHNLELLHQIYMQTHFRYIVGHTMLRKVSYFLWKPIALIGKVIYKNHD